MQSPPIINLAETLSTTLNIYVDSAGAGGAQCKKQKK